MFVHFVEAVEHFAEVFRADRDHRREADCGLHRVAPADADIDHIADAPIGMPPPGAAADAIREVGHPIEDCMDLGYDILAINHEGCASRSTQRHVHDGPPFRYVDLLSAEHSVDPPAQA